MQGIEDIMMEPVATQPYAIGSQVARGDANAMTNSELNKLAELEICSAEICTQFRDTLESELEQQTQLYVLKYSCINYNTLK